MQGIEQAPDLKTRMLMAAVFLLPLWMAGSLLALGAFALLRLVSKTDRKEWLIQLKRPGWHWVLPLFFLLHAFGLLWSSNLKFGFRDLETKMSFLLIPLLLSGLDLRKSWSVIRSAFLSGCFLACAYLLLGAFKAYLQQGKGMSFFYIEFSSPLMHPTYMSMLINLALLLLIQRISETAQEHSSGFKLWGVMVFFWLMLDLLSARMPFLVTSIGCAGYLIVFVIRKAMPKSSAIGCTVCMLIGLAGMVMSSAYTGRVNEVGQAISASPSGSTGIATYNSTTGRLEIWRQGIELLPEVMPWGTGTGDVKDAMLESYRSNDFHYGLERSLNAHNQYLQTAIALGVPGLILLLLILAIPFLDKGRKVDPIAIWFLLLVALNALVESILEVQRGVLMVTLFIPLLMSLARPRESVDGMP